MPIPSWAPSVIQQEQVIQDAKYADLVRAYDAASTDWINDNIVNRADGLPISPLPPMPQKLRFFWNDTTNLIDQAVIPDPTVTAPVLPPPVPSQPPTQFTTGAPQQSTEIDQIFALIKKIADQLGVK